jgi:uncharacterized protein with NAD-binding domain and iron-sulfur cluster
LVPGSGRDGRADLPGEHGFRFFPGFYKHLPDTMKRIPFRGQAGGVFGNLVYPDHIDISRADHAPIVLPSHPPHALGGYMDYLHLLAGSGTGISASEIAFFGSKLEYYLTSCDERRFAELESVSWWDFVEADKHSKAYQKFFAIGITRTLVAAKAERMSARTGFSILTQLIFNAMGQGTGADRILNGPTNDVWLDPWMEYLRGNGVDYRLGASVQGLELDGGRISGAWVCENGETRLIEADHFVSCVPIEVMQKWLTPELVSLDPALGRLSRLSTEWMSGIQFYLKRDIQVTRGHCILIDSPWALTMISQPQFWGDTRISDRGDGSVRGLISIDVSDWNSPGVLYGKPAKQCSKQEVFEEVWAQLKMHLRNHEGVGLSDGDLLSWFLDPGITFPEPGRVESAEPLLVNLKGSWWDRPEAVLQVPNLYLASDYVRSVTDLATMEGANEAARVAVNGILAASGSREEPCKLWKLEESAVFAPAKELDRLRFKLGLGHGAV